MRRKIFGVLAFISLAVLFGVAGSLERDAISIGTFIPWAAGSLFGFGLFGWLSGALEFGSHPEDVWAAIRRREPKPEEEDTAPLRKFVTWYPDGTQKISYR